MSASKKIVQLLTRKIIRIKRRRRKRNLKKNKMVMYLKSEFRNSIIHGVPYIVNEEIHWFERAFWTVSFVFCIILINKLLATQFQRFTDTPTVMNVEMDYFNWNISYPAFTLCPTSNKADKEAFSSLLNETALRTGKNLESYLRSIIGANIESLDMLDYQTPDIIPLIDPKDYIRIAASVFKKFDESSLTTNNNLPISVDMVMTEIGLCHVINSNIAKFDNPYQWNNRSATYTKTNVELSVYDRDFFTQIMDYDDIYKVLIHSPDETILGTTSSFTHTLRGFVSFGVQVWSTKISDTVRNFPIQLRKCRFSNEPISKRYPIYSYTHCMLECRIKMILKLCGCIPHYYKPLDNERICNLGELKCIMQYKKEILTLSTARKTLEKFKDTKDLPITSHDCGCVSQCEIDVYQKDYENYIAQSDINRLRIGFTSYPKVRVVRNIIFSFSDAILKIGGVINLCIGASLISCVEFCMTIIRMPVFQLIHKIRGIKDSA